MDHRMPMDWTDEKHNLYLKSMEASFVDQLYNSFDLLGCHPQKVNPSDSRPSSQMHCKARVSSGQVLNLLLSLFHVWFPHFIYFWPHIFVLSFQFKVFRSGFWQRMNFERARKQMVKADGSPVLLANPWVQHFRSLSRDEAVALPDIERHGASTSKVVSSRGKMPSSCGLATTSKQFPMYHCRLFQPESIGTDEGTPQEYIFVFSEIFSFLHLHPCMHAY